MTGHSKTGLRRALAITALIAVILPAAARSATVSEAKLLPDAAPVTLPAKTVTCVSTDFFYVQEDNRGVGLADAPVGGICVKKTAHGLAAGARVNVSGTMRTNEKLERYIDCTSATSTTGTGIVVPWMAPNRSVGGLNVGLLVRTTGFVNYVDPNLAFAYIDDGSSLYDGNAAGPMGAGINGLRVILPASVTAPKMTQYVTVTGISYLDTVAGAPARAILVREIVRDDDATLLSNMNMLCVPGGDYLMGNSGTGDDATFGYPREYPQHPVETPTFWISQCEVTRGQYNQFIAAGGYTNAAYWSGEGWSWKLSIGRAQPGYWDSTAAWEASSRPTYWAPRSFSQTDSHPVVGISYYEAEAFCKWAGGRLPTEAEWEKAARWDGTPRIYPWGSAADKTKCNDWYDTTYRGFRTAPVTSYSTNASPHGCLGMAGNVWEWTSDWHKSYPGSNSPFDKSGIARSLRGGGWYGVYGERCASRWFAAPSATDNDIGFRVAR